MITKYALFKVFNVIRKSSNPESVRSLALKAKVSPSTSKACCDYLMKNGLMNRKVIGNVYQHTLNEENVLLRHLKITASLAELQGSGLVEELVKAYPSITSIILFGSVASGTDKPNSDIDILIISSRDLKLRLLRAEKKLSRELSIVKYTYSQWRIAPRTNKAFYDYLISDSIPLYGETPMVK